MPELPEVETIRRQLAPRIVGRAITDAWAFDSPRFSEARNAVGSQFTALRRLGKYLIFDLATTGPGGLGTDPTLQLIVHLGMTGRLTVEEITGISEDTDHDKYLRASWDMDGGSRLLFHDVRRFGRIAVVEPGEYAELPTLANLGPEPLTGDFTPKHLVDAMTGDRQIKTVLLGQRAVAGVGNIYADEALWLAGIRPTVRRLGRERAGMLHEAIVEVLEAGLDDGGTTLRDYRNAEGEGGSHQNRLHCYGRAGKQCEKCGEVLRGSKVDGRGTTY